MYKHPFITIKIHNHSLHEQKDYDFFNNNRKLEPTVLWIQKYFSKPSHLLHTPIALTTQKKKRHFLLAFSLQASTIQLCVHKCP